MPDRLLSAARPILAGGVVGLLGFGAIFAAYSIVSDTEFGRSLTAEDGFVETVGAAAFLIAAVLQAVLYWGSDVPRPQRLISSLRRNPFYLGLAVLLFLAFAEEISWGQRIFGWETPEAMLTANAQGEMNIHNLVPFQGGGSLLNAHRLGNIFWLLYCVLLPLTVVALPRVRRFGQRISLPVPPLWIGGLFVGCYLAYRLYVVFIGTGRLGNSGELQETLLASCFVVLGLAQLRARDVGGDMQADPPSASDRRRRWGRLGRGASAPGSAQDASR